MQLPEILNIEKKQIDEGTVLLFHGSKGGIVGNIKPISRRYCDFGSGFYMGTEEKQSLTLIYNFPNAKLYTLKTDLSGLKVLDFQVGIDWALLIAYHRGKLEGIKGSSLYQKYSEITLDCDIIVGNIANDRMFVVLDRFFTGGITDKALISSLSALELGRQYVALTERACRQIEIMQEKMLSGAKREALCIESELHRQEGIRLADAICKKHRRDGRFFDEIISGDLLV
jgi:hypothetical protein